MPCISASSWSASPGRPVIGAFFALPTLATCARRRAVPPVGELLIKWASSLIIAGWNCPLV